MERYIYSVHRLENNTVKKSIHPSLYMWTSLVAQTAKHLCTMWETWVQSLGQKIPWGRKWQPSPVFLPGESHGWRSLVGYSSLGHKESDMTE